MPGESRTITFEFDEKYLSGSQPAMAVEGWNINPAAVNCDPLPDDPDPGDVLGDVNEDGDITSADALLALQGATDKIDLTDTQTAAADVDATPGVTSADALLILQKATRKIEEFPK